MATPNPRKRSTVTPAELTMIGAAGGFIEVCLLQPTVGIKNALQEGRPIPRNPAHLYRGLAINAGSMAPITASQFGTNRFMERFLSGSSDQPLSSAQRFSCAAVSGGVSAFIGSPSEMIIIQQQKSGRSLLAELRNFFGTYQAHSIYRGLGTCIGRETLYAAGYLGLCPILKDKLDSSPAMADLPKGTNMLIAGVTGGVFAAACSHPFDTIKTRMQAFMYTKPEYMTWHQSARTIYAEGGVLRFWRGLLPRMSRIIAATFILNTVRTKTVAHLEDKRAVAAAAGLPEPGFMS